MPNSVPSVHLSSIIIVGRLHHQRGISDPTHGDRDAFYDRGSIFPLNRLLNDGVP